MRCHGALTRAFLGNRHDGHRWTALVTIQALLVCFTG